MPAHHKIAFRIPLHMIKLGQWSWKYTDGSSKWILGFVVTDIEKKKINKWNLGLCNHHHSQLQNISSPHKEILQQSRPSPQAPLWPSPRGLLIYFVSIGLPMLYSSYKWHYILCGLLRLLLSLYITFSTCLCVVAYISISFLFHCPTIVHCMVILI